MTFMQPIHAQEAMLDPGYLLARAEEELEMARSAQDSVARLIHYDLAGRYALAAARPRHGHAPGGGAEVDGLRSLERPGALQR